MTGKKPLVEKFTKQEVLLDPDFRESNGGLTRVNQLLDVNTGENLHTWPCYTALLALIASVSVDIFDFLS